MSIFLPDQVIEEILSRTPAKSLVRFRCVCKKWHDLIFNPSFINLHLNKSVERRAINFTLCYWETSRSYFLDVGNPNDRFVKLGHRIPGYQQHQDRLGSCNGLLFFVNNDHHTISVLNPSTRTQKLIEQKVVIFSSCATGVFYDPNSSDYKLLKITEKTSISSEAMIYSLGNSTWTLVEGRLPYVLKTREGVLVSGALHWAAASVSESHTDVILAYNLTDGNFREMPLPEGCNYTGRVIKWGSSLCILFKHEKSIVVWTMKEYGNKDSWSKLFVMNNQGKDFGRKWDVSVIPQNVAVNGKILFYIMEKLQADLCWYDPENGTFRKIELVAKHPFSRKLKEINNKCYQLVTHLDSLLDFEQILVRGRGERHSLNGCIQADTQFLKSRKPS